MQQLEQALESNGFREFKEHRPATHQSAKSRWQIRIRGNSGATLYFVNAYLYENLRTNLDSEVEFETCLYPSLSTKHWVTLTFHGSKMEEDIHTAMEFFRHAYNHLWCQPDPHNQ